MSFAERAKKTFWGSISKRKKLKISRKVDTNAAALNHPQPQKLVQRTISLCEEESRLQQLQSSQSLPDQLDQPVSPGTSVLTCRSLSSIDSIYPTSELSLLNHDSPSKSQYLRRIFSENRSRSTSSDYEDLTPSLDHKKKDGVRNNETAEVDSRERAQPNLGVYYNLNNQSEKYSTGTDQKRFVDNHHSVEANNSSNLDETDKDAAHLQNPIQITYLNHSEACPNFDSDVCVYNHKPPSSNCVSCQQDKELGSVRKEHFNEDTEIILESKNQHAQLLSMTETDAFSDFESVTSFEPENSINLTKDATNDGFSGESITDQTTSEPGQSDIRKYKRHGSGLSKLWRSDSSVFKKIKFFETKQGLNASASNINKLSSDVDDHAAKTPQTSSTSGSPNVELSGTSSDAVYGQIKSSPRTSSGPSGRQRLNFSRFRRSDSIPEVMANSSSGDLDEAQDAGELGSLLQTPEDNLSASDSVFDVSAEETGDESITHQVCHHPACTELNDDMPLLLCQGCDLRIHKEPGYNQHLVLDRKPQQLSQSVENVSVSAGEAESGLVAGDSDGEVWVSSWRKQLGDKEKRKSDKNLLKFISAKSKDEYNLDEAQKRNQPTVADGAEFYVSRMDSETSDYGSQKSSFSGGVSQPEEDPWLVNGRSEFTDVFTESTSPSTTLLSRSRSKAPSQVSASRTHFMLKFGSNFSCEDELVVVAVNPSKNLRMTLEPVLEERHIDINSIDVFIESSNTPLPLASDSYFLAGNTLEVKVSERDSYEGAKVNPKSKRAIKSATLDGSQRGRPKLSQVDDSGLSLSASTKSLISDMRKVRPSKQTKSGSFSKDKERQEQLAEILTSWSSQGLPPTSELMTPGRQQFEESIFELEPTWKAFVSNHEDLSKKQAEHQEAVWELLHTEVSYIKQVRVILEVFKNCLINLQQESFLNEIETERLFSNIDNVYECNCMFWQNGLLPVLQASRDSGLPLNPLLLKESFIDHFPALFQVYFKYLMEQKSCVDYCRSSIDSSDLFKRFIQWAETQKQCNRLRLSDILVQPMSRLTKYSLLLHAILKYTENERDKVDLQAMIQSVDKFCETANSNVRRKEEYERLEAFSKTIEPLEALEVPNEECAKIMQEVLQKMPCPFNLLTPMSGYKDGPRSLLFQSSLKMKEAQNAKMDVDCLLFTDLLLICKSNRKMDKFKIIRPPMRLDQIVIRELKDKGSFLLIYLNEFQVPLSACTFHSDGGAIRGWLEKFREAQKEFKVKDGEKNPLFYYYLMPAEMDNAPHTPRGLDTEIVTTPVRYSSSITSMDRFVPNLPSQAANQTDLGRSRSMVAFPSFSSSVPGSREIPSAISDNSRRHQSISDSLTAVPAFESSPGQMDGEAENFDGRLVFNVQKQKFVTRHSVPNMVSGSKSSSTISNSSLESIPALDDSRKLPEPPEVRFSESTLRSFSSPGPAVSEANSGVSSEDEDTARTKFNSRRTEKRYKTADEVLDFQNLKKDPSIHKWSSLRNDGQIISSSNLTSCTPSSESLQSSPSSSGVSSNGSLHLTLEASEELEAVAENSDTSCELSPTKVDHRKHFSTDHSNDIHDAPDGVASVTLKPESRHSKSKSTSDLVEAYRSPQTSHMTDGIASAAVTSDRSDLRLTRHMIKMKKFQILLDADVESSEV